MAKAKWARVNPGLLSALTPIKGGTMVMATIAKKHMTIFVRSRRAPGAGHQDVKDAFAAAAHKTLGEKDRVKRNKLIADAVRGKGPGERKVKSKAKPGSPLYGKVYTYPTR